jgi:hypothetical protein
MQYLVSVIFDEAGLATPDEQAAIDVFNDRLQAEGHWVCVVAATLSCCPIADARRPGKTL